MPAATDLLQAAALAEENLFIKWSAGTIQTDVVSFCVDAAPIFPEAIPINHTIGDWLAVLSAFAQSNPITTYPGVGVGRNMLALFQQDVDYVYRLCKLAWHLDFDASLIT